LTGGEGRRAPDLRPIGTTTLQSQAEAKEKKSEKSVKGGKIGNETTNLHEKKLLYP